MAKARVPIPENPKELLDLAQSIITKRVADKAASPLAGIGAEWDTAAPLVAKAIEKHELAEDLRRQMERAYEERDNVVKQVQPLITRSRDILTGFYGPANMRKLGEHGFTVDDTARPPKGPSK